MTQLNGLILAGGRSERMGRDKGAIEYHGIAQTHYLAGLLAPFVSEVFISVRKEQMQAAHVQPLPLILDHYSCPSPLNGIVSAMREYPNTSWLVVAVDMPFIDKDSIETLLAGRDQNVIATCFESPAKGGPDPLFAIWEDHGFTRLEFMISKRTDHVCPRAALTIFPAKLLPSTTLGWKLDNINTPQELARLQEKAS